MFDAQDRGVRDGLRVSRDAAKSEVEDRLYAREVDAGE